MAVPGKGAAGAAQVVSALEALQRHRSERFSGKLSFEHAGQTGAAFLQQGEVVHAEAGTARGEDALRLLAGWQGAWVEAHANVSTVARTIDERAGRALLEALQVAAQRPGVTPPPLPGVPAQRASTTTERARAVPGVTYAAVLRGGTAVNDPDPRAEALSHRAAQLLSRLALPLSKALSLGDLSRGAIASAEAEQFLLFHAQDAYLAVSVEPGAPLAEVEVGIRKALSARKAE